MTTKEYLESVLSAQNLGDDSKELKALQAERKNVEGVLRSAFESADLTIRYAGSKAKGTLVKESYDLDIVSYFGSEDTTAGETLADIYSSVKKALEPKYVVEERTSALRLKSKDPATYGADFHIDVVPGRFVDGRSGDCYLYQNSAEKQRLKTNIDIHIAHVRDSGVVDAIRLIKLWRKRKGLSTKQFVLELLVIKLLEDKKKSSLADQLLHVWTEISDSAEAIAVQDPANPEGNDLSSFLKNTWWELRSSASSTLDTIKNSDWETVYGSVESQTETDAARASLAAATVSGSKPWGDVDAHSGRS